MKKIFNFGPENACILVKVVNHSICKPHEKTLNWIIHCIYGINFSYYMNCYVTH